jgi:hypothetical protein
MLVKIIVYLLKQFIDQVCWRRSSMNSSLDICPSPFLSTC